jgi:stage II sporulation protein D
LRSANYEVHDAGDGFLFHGYGSGHGVGLCQAGAERMGGAGKSYREILDYYYPGTRAGLSAQGIAWRRLASERLEMWTTRPAEDQSLIPLAERLLRDAERRTGFPARVLPQLRVYPSLALFRDSTGEPGTVAASTRGRVIRLQPPAVLRSRGMLESTLFHELLHVLIETRARPGLPLWFREGLVVYLTGGPGRVTSLAATHSRAAVLSWVETGLPPGL